MTTIDDHTTSLTSSLEIVKPHDICLIYLRYAAFVTVTAILGYGAIRRSTEGAGPRSQSHWRHELHLQLHYCCSCLEPTRETEEVLSSADFGDEHSRHVKQYLVGDEYMADSF